jgi:hypothetical protein
MIGRQSDREHYHASPTLTQSGSVITGRAASFDGSWSDPWRQQPNPERENDVAARGSGPPIEADFVTAQISVRSARR